MHKKKIVFILPDLNPGGAEKITTILINNIDKQKYIPKLILMRKEGIYLDILDDSTEIIDLKIQRIRQSIIPILKYFINQKPDIVFIGYGEVNAFLAPFISFFPNIKFIVRETNVVSEHITKPIIKFFYKFYSNYKNIIAQSDDMKFDLINNFNIKDNKIIKINNPIDVQFIESKLLETFNDTIFTKNTNTKKVLAIANLSFRKGIDNLLKVFSYLKNEKIELFILGEGAEKEDYLKLKENLALQNVHFLGIKQNPYIYLQNSDLFILSSRYEGFPNVLLEAGVCGTYSFSNNCKGGINEIIQHKINGEISDINNHEDFAENIIRILNENKDNNKIKHSIISRFSKEIILKKYYHIFDNL